MDLENNENIETPSELKKANWFNRPTTFSKILAMILFIVLPFVAFYFGINYQKMITENNCLIENDKDQSLLTATPTEAPTETPTPIISPKTAPENWKTFSSTTEGFTIKYPNDWNIENSSDGNCGHTELNGSKCRDRYDFVSPDQIRVRYVIHKDENNDKISCGQQSYCESQNILGIDNLNVPNFGQVELVKLDREVKLHKPISAVTSPIVGENKHDDFMIDFTLPSKTGGRYDIFVTTTTAGYEPTWLKNMTTEQLYKLESVKEGIEILKSLSY